MSSEITPYREPAGLDLVEVRLRPEIYPRLCNYKEESAKVTLAGVVAMAYTYVGKQYEAADLRLVASGLYAELMRDPDNVGTKNITPDEIAHAVRSAILGQESMYGINVASLYKAVRAYCLGAGMEAQKEANKRHHDARVAALKASAAGAMIEAYAGQMTKTLNSSHK